MNRFRESSCISSSDEESVEESDWHDSQLSDDDDDKVSNTTLKNSDHAPKKLPKKRGLNVATIVLQRELGRKFFHSTSKKDLLLRLLFNFSSEEQLYMKDRSRLVNIFRSLLKRQPHIWESKLLFRIIQSEIPKFSNTSQRETLLISSHQALLQTKAISFTEILKSLFLNMIANKWTLGNSAGQDLLITVCGEYKGAYLSELLEFLCANGVSINQVDYEKRNALMKLSKNDPTSGQEVYEAVRILIRREINVNQIDFQGCNALFHFIRNRRVRCCRYCWLVEVNRSTFWEILELLLSAGADVDQTDEHGDTVLFEILSKISSRDWNHIPCPSCIQLKRTTENTNGIGHFYRVLRFVERLLKAGVSTYVKSEEDEEKNESVLFYVCAHFTGDELMELVELLCANGVSVNCRTTRGNSRKPLNALQVLEMENPTQASRITQLMDIMKRYGFKP